MRSPNPQAKQNQTEPLKRYTAGDWAGYFIVYSVPGFGALVSLYFAWLKKSVEPNLRSFSRAVVFFQALGYAVYFVDLLLDPTLR